MDVKPKNGDVTDDNIDISSLPEKARKLLSEFDKNGDGTNFDRLKYSFNETRLRSFIKCNSNLSDGPETLERAV